MYKTINHSKIPNSKTPNNMISRYEIPILNTKDPTKNILILNDNTKHELNATHKRDGSIVPVILQHNPPHFSN
jgi:hypothetical protein